MFMFAAALLMVACSNEDVAVNDDVKYVTELKLNFGSGDSRIAATHSTAGLNFAWEQGDEIKIFQNREGYSASVYYVYDKTSESFKPKTSVAMQEGSDYFAVKLLPNLPPLAESENSEIVVKVAPSSSLTGISTIPTKWCMVAIVPPASAVNTSEINGSLFMLMLLSNFKSTCT